MVYPKTTAGQYVYFNFTMKQHERLPCDTRGQAHRLREVVRTNAFTPNTPLHGCTDTNLWQYPDPDRGTQTPGQP